MAIVIINKFCSLMTLYAYTQFLMFLIQVVRPDGVGSSETALQGFKLTLVRSNFESQDIKEV